MKKKLSSITEAEILRKRAKELLKKKSFKATPIHSEADTLKLIHELQVHQIELEMQNEELIRAKEEADIAVRKYIELYDFAPSGYFTLSQEGKIIGLNISGARMLGKERQLLINRNFTFFISNDTKLVFTQFLTKVFKEKNEESCEVTLSIEGKLPVYIYLSGQVTEDEIRCNLTLVDITQLKYAEFALKESEEKYRMLYDSNKMPISIFDTETLKFLSVNNAFVEKYGYTREEFLNMTILDIRPESELNKLKESVKTIDEGVVNAGVFIHKKKNREIIQVEILRHDLVFDGKKAKLVFVNDVTDKIRVENDLKESERRLFKLNADKDRFISILSHDLRSPFNNLLGLSEILTENIQEYHIDEIKNIVGDINKTAQRTYNLLENILTWARAQQGKIPFNPQILSFTDICNNNLEIFIPNAIAKNITINCNPSDEINIYVDIDMLKTVMRNLVSNAIKFTNTGGTININAEQNSENVTISVSDNGIGIAPDDLKKLFDISEVMTTKGTAGETGTGLGLLLCKEFVEKHQGKIWVESEVGKGSDFKFTLPIPSEQANAVNN